MNGIDFLANTNFIINFKNGKNSIEKFSDYSFAISFIREMELLCAYNISKEERKIYIKIIDETYLIEFDSKIKKNPSI